MAQMIGERVTRYPPKNLSRTPKEPSGELQKKLSRTPKNRR
jgi:hypothetical protein